MTFHPIKDTITMIASITSSFRLIVRHHESAKVICTHSYNNRYFTNHQYSVVGFLLPKKEGPEPKPRCYEKEKVYVKKVFPLFDYYYTGIL